MDNTDKDFYNYESEKYSRKRYEGITESYGQFLFKNRRKIVLDLLSKVIGDKQDLLLLDIACADGVISKAIDNSFPNTFSKFVGTDIAPRMIDVAKRNFSEDSRFSFFIKNTCPITRFDIVLGLGYLSAPIFDTEMDFLMMRIKPGGYYLCTLSPNNSLFAKIKLKNSPLIVGYRTYPEYKKMLSRYFEIIEEVPSGFFIPKLWSFPAIARLVQPIMEKLFKNIFPNLFHEKVYLLRKK